MSIEHSAAASSSAASSTHGVVQRFWQLEQERKPPLPPKRGGGKRRVWAWEARRARWWAREWDRAYLLACAAGLMVDPLFLYAVSVSGPLMCVFLDGWFAAAVTVLRCMVDVMHAWNLLLRLRTAVRPEDDGAGEEEAQRRADDGNGGAAPAQVARPVSKKGLVLDLFVILPLMQVIMWVTAPAMIRAGSTTAVMTMLLVSFLFEYLPKIYHAIRFLRRMQNASGYVFGTIWWGIALNLMAYFVAAHAVGACWYLLGAQRATKCLKEQCAQAGSRCAPGALACAAPLYYGGAVGGGVGADRLSWARDDTARGTCLDSGDNYQYGAYKWTVMLVANPSRLEKILLPIFWGLMTLSTFGNLASTTEWLEIVFNIITITGGLILVTMLIGNIKVFLNATTSRKQAMQARLRGLEWWMKRKKLPQSFRHRARQHERQRWAATRGVDECRIVRDLPEGLRRDIKYHLCLDLVRQVPLFQHMDDLVLENICDKVKSLVFPKGEVIVREGDPVQRMLFIVRGHLQSSQVLRNGATSCCTLGPGNFSGDELLSWCMRRPFLERLPASSSTLVTMESTEGFGLEAADVKYVTQHFRHTFTNDKVRRSARYYSHGWRTWAAVAVQLAWRRYKHRKTLASLSFIRPRRPLSRCSSLGEEKLRLYTAILTSPKPNQDDLM
ncbi:cyclic nucleotide-gated ion channel 4-like [Oryza brachyantha]|uniref:cyclic nucleotide-gated ion channel 4-like n=1 Tax=Oryza brachyantha TaxID=4533 RepID=UPI001ADC6DA6|nr:cyclic nucleotide-gated ion channel 4-like [Oryza brachyantha]